MFDAFRKFLSDCTAGDKHPGRFEDDDYRLAASALLVHTAAIDGEVSPAERDKLHAVIKGRFELDEATAAEQQAVDLYHFTSLINRSLDEAGRRRIVEMMWEIIYADERVSEFEENVIWRASDLLGISSRERIEIGRRIAAERAPSDDDR